MKLKNIYLKITQCCHFNLQIIANWLLNWIYSKLHIILYEFIEFYNELHNFIFLQNNKSKDRFYDDEIYYLYHDFV